MRSGSILLLAMAALWGRSMQAQCPQLYDYYGNPSAAPEWFSCSGTNFALLIASPQAVGAFTIDWGDGSPLHNGASLVAPQTVSHVYVSAVAEYTIVFTELSSGCTITGTLVMEESSSASIQIPVGGLTQVCAPEAVEFINSSTNVSPNTVFTWDFGDGSPLLTFDHTNWGQTISHTYQQGTVDCETTVRLTAENTCNDLQGGASFATFNPIRIWDIDDATIAPSATLLCWPDRTVTFANTTNRNCLNQGNIYQRYEYWNFGDYWGTGQDSIIDWTPWPPTFPRTIQYPGIGSYEVMLLDSNYCGIDTAYVTINIVPPPSVSLTATPNPVCAGETVNFDETTTGGANYFQWDFGTGNGFQWTGAGDQAFNFNTAGSYTVRYTASIQGATAGCADTASVVVDVLPSPTAGFAVDNDAACDQLTVAFTNTSVNAISHQWDFGDGTTSTDPDPPPHDYTVPGSYTITLRVMNGQGCQDIATQVVNVYEPPQVQIGAQNVCEGSDAEFADLTVTEPGNTIISWAWDFGDGATADVQAPTHLYAAPGAYVVTLTTTTPYCSGTGTLPVVVEARPQASFLPDDDLGCSPHTVNFSNTSIGGVNAIWTFGDGGASNDDSPSHTYLNLGTQDTIYTAQLIMTSAFGCADSISVPITVAP
ncbi:MAG TPA: PKD domain-containing protein, partial [Flavobacteriales bacterium]|nr:PKD domain-containing protein [Flavobacteriales bacterium]